MGHGGGGGGGGRGMYVFPTFGYCHLMMQLLRVPEGGQLEGKIFSRCLHHLFQVATHVELAFTAEFTSV